MHFATRDFPDLNDSLSVAIDWKRASQVSGNNLQDGLRVLQGRGRGGGGDLEGAVDGGG
jgi:hypothetical protein